MMDGIAKMIWQFAENFLKHYNDGDLAGEKTMPFHTGRKVAYAKSCTGSYPLYEPSEMESGLCVAYERNEAKKTTKIVFERSFYDRTRNIPFERNGVFVSFGFEVVEKILIESGFVAEKFAALLLGVLPKDGEQPVRVSVNNEKPTQGTLF